MTRVSVIIPAYNAESTIRRAVDSVMAQRCDDTEVIVVDDGSTDSTRCVLDGYGRTLRILHQPNRGPAAARNTGQRASSGEYIAFLDADDAWLPDKLAKTVAALERNPDAVLAYSEYFHVDDRGQIIGTSQVGPPPSMRSMLKVGWAKVTSTVVMRHQTLERCGGFCEEFRNPGLEDLWTWLLAREQGNFEYVPEPLVLYRQPSAQGDEYRYLATRKPFLRLAEARYGKRSHGLRRSVNRFFASLFFGAALREMRLAHHRNALTAVTRCLWYYPFYPLEVLSERCGRRQRIREG